MDQLSQPGSEAHSHHVTSPPCLQCGLSYPSICPCPITSRGRWGAESPASSAPHQQSPRVEFICHTEIQTVPAGIHKHVLLAKASAGLVLSSLSSFPSKQESTPQKNRSPPPIKWWWQRGRFGTAWAGGERGGTELEPGVSFPNASNTGGRAPSSHDQSAPQQGGDGRPSTRSQILECNRPPAGSGVQQGAGRVTRSLWLVAVGEEQASISGYPGWSSPTAHCCWGPVPAPVRGQRAWN